LDDFNFLCGVKKLWQGIGYPMTDSATIQDTFTYPPEKVISLSTYSASRKNIVRFCEGVLEMEGYMIRKQVVKPEILIKQLKEIQKHIG